MCRCPALRRLSPKNGKCWTACCRDRDCIQNQRWAWNMIKWVRHPGHRRWSKSCRLFKGQEDCACCCAFPPKSSWLSGAAGQCSGWVPKLAQRHRRGPGWHGSVGNRQAQQLRLVFSTFPLATVVFLTHTTRPAQQSALNIDSRASGDLIVSGLV